MNIFYSIEVMVLAIVGDLCLHYELCLKAMF